MHTLKRTQNTLLHANILLQATSEYMDAHKPLSAWMLPPERRCV